ncbi:PDZ domain-containing protein [Fulvivirga sp. RKSG066]|uniref:S41 family peptidase n=1 Tax=Fulvivirga aurantia TaxID=2529383 RepID=UPI0012BC79B1|nr:S41 family peptidase [Fulvivirga aurantia]MTI22343.1 PDZ domain-containing protein [Fulvivirga aurantia]
MKSRFYTFLVLLISFSMGMVACNEDDTPTPDTDLTLEEEINSWIFDVMDEVYFWTAEIPDNVNKKQDPSDYFRELLFNGDRFSGIVPDYQDLINSLNGITLEAGYEFYLIQETGTDNIVGLIKYVKTGSPADEAGLQRGDLITAVNGQSATTSNYQTVFGQVSSDHTLSYARYNKSSDTYVAQNDVDLDAVQFAENPILLDTVLNVSSKKIGYLVYNFFSAGTNNTYDNELNATFTDFKSDGINDLVIDLRYNSGGSINSATVLASNVAPDVTTTDIFYKNQWNELYTDFWQNEPNGEERLFGYFKNLTSSVGSSIGGNVYILTGSNTASASELVINGLIPYMNVTIIGETTVGKNVGSIPFEDTDNEDNNYGILPIVIKLANSEDFSDYGQGFTPLAENKIRELDFRLIQLGDVNEPLLARAIELIAGTSTGGRKAARVKNEVTSLGSSIDKHLRSNRAVLSPLKRK